MRGRYGASGSIPFAVQIGAIAFLVLGSTDAASARGSHGGGDFPVSALFPLLLVIFALGAWLIRRAMTPQQAPIDKERTEALLREAEQWITNVQKDGLALISTRVILKDGEVALLDQDATLFEARSYRVYGGTGTRVGGIYVGGGVSESQQRLKQIDDGKLTLTTKRLVFDGPRENRTVQLSSLLSVKPWADAVEVNTEHRTKSQVYRVANPYLWALLMRLTAAGGLKPQPTD